MVKKILWALSTALTLFFIVLLGSKLYEVNKNYDPDSEQLANLDSVEQYLKLKTHLSESFPYRILTGIFLETVNFAGKGDRVDLSGYIWQHYDNQLPADIKKGVLFPDSVETKLKQIYQLKEDHSTLIGWAFEAKVPQTFKFTHYPLDHKIIKLRIWHRGFFQPVILLPDLKAYRSTDARDKFGLDQDILLQGFTPLETFFKYTMPTYDTSFGLAGGVYEGLRPELSFNVVLKRNVWNAFVVNVMPLIAVLLLVYAILLMITTIPDDINSFDFKLSGVLRLCGVLLFAMLLAHGQMRSNFKGADIVYMEYLYFITYGAILYLGLNAFFVLKGLNHRLRFKLLFFEDNILPKVLFLPLVFGVMLWVTYWQFGF